MNFEENSIDQTEGLILNNLEDQSIKELHQRWSFHKESTNQKKKILNKVNLWKECSYQMKKTWWVIKIIT